MHFIYYAACRDFVRGTITSENVVGPLVSISDMKVSGETSVLRSGFASRFHTYCCELCMMIGFWYVILGKTLQTLKIPLEAHVSVIMMGLYSLQARRHIIIWFYWQPQFQLIFGRHECHIEKHFPSRFAASLNKIVTVYKVNEISTHCCNPIHCKTFWNPVLAIGTVGKLFQIHAGIVCLK